MYKPAHPEEFKSGQNEVKLTEAFRPLLMWWFIIDMVNRPHVIYCF